MLLLFGGLASLIRYVLWVSKKDIIQNWGPIKAYRRNLQNLLK